jgi:hypothetical protein
VGLKGSGGGVCVFGCAGLRRQADDERREQYSEEQLEQGRTHCNIWNAAQMEMVITGTYLRTQAETLDPTPHTPHPQSLKTLKHECPGDDSCSLQAEGEGRGESG